MRSSLAGRDSSNRYSITGGIAAILCSVGLIAVDAQSPGIQIVRVEEDWELHVETTHQETAAPQVTCTMSPFCDLNGIHAAFDLNHQSQPDFTAGGMQLQIWDGECVVADTRYRDNELLNTDGEIIRWTQSMEINGGHLRFQIDDGQSSTWGEFDHSDNLRLDVDADLQNLNNYHPDVSVAHSGVGYASNRVCHLILKEVRCYTATGEVYIDTTQRVAHSTE